jgi:hypothetical protein
MGVGVDFAAAAAAPASLIATAVARVRSAGVVPSTHNIAALPSTNDGAPRRGLLGDENRMAFALAYFTFSRPFGSLLVCP